MKQKSKLMLTAVLLMVPLSVFADSEYPIIDSAEAVDYPYSSYGSGAVQYVGMDGRTYMVVPAHCERHSAGYTYQARNTYSPFFNSRVTRTERYGGDARNDEMYGYSDNVYQESGLDKTQKVINILTGIIGIASFFR